MSINFNSYKAAKSDLSQLTSETRSLNAEIDEASLKGRTNELGKFIPQLNNLDTKLNRDIQTIEAFHKSGLLGFAMSIVDFIQSTLVKAKANQESIQGDLSRIETVFNPDKKMESLRKATLEIPDDQKEALLKTLKTAIQNEAPSRFISKDSAKIASFEALLLLNSDIEKLSYVYTNLIKIKNSVDKPIDLDKFEGNDLAAKLKTNMPRDHLILLGLELKSGPTLKVPLASTSTSNKFDAKEIKENPILENYFTLESKKFIKSFLDEKQIDKLPPEILNKLEAKIGSNHVIELSQSEELDRRFLSSLLEGADDTWKTLLIQDKFDAWSVSEKQP